MRVPISWLREYAPIPAPVDAHEVGRRLTAAGLEVEAVEQVGHDVHGVIVAQVLTIEELTGFKKPIRYCRVAVSDAELTADPETVTGVICGATNFSAGDRVAFATPGATLPGGFEITAAKKYGRVSQGMICAVDELGIGEDHSGILILPPDTPLGVDFTEYARLRDDVLDITVTPDRGYAVSIRGVARELASAYQVPYTDPAQTFIPGEDAPGMRRAGRRNAAPGTGPWPAAIADPTACDRFVLREVRGFDPRPRRRCGCWSASPAAACAAVSLAVDVTNYLMLELGQPLHAFDRAKLHRADRRPARAPGRDADHARPRHPHAGRRPTSSSPTTAARSRWRARWAAWRPRSTTTPPTSSSRARTSPTPAPRRWPAGTACTPRRPTGSSAAPTASCRCAPPRAPPRCSPPSAARRSCPASRTRRCRSTPVTISMAADYPDRVAGVIYGMDTVVARLQEVGCEVRSTPARSRRRSRPGAAQPPPDGARRPAHRHEHGKHDRQHMVLLVTPPSWRPDLTDPADLAEEVIRLEGYGNVPVSQPRATAGRGLTERQRSLRAIARTLGAAGFVEVHSDPFAPATEADSLMLAAARTRAAPRSRSRTR